MPHVILTGEADLIEVARAFAPFRADAGGWIIRLKGIFASPDGRTAIVDCTAVRSGFSQDFYVRLEAKRGVTGVRVDPYMRIERNEGVQRAVAALARRMQSQFTAMQIEKTNLPGEWLVAEAAVTESPDAGHS